ncbi:MAG TPA: aldolase/citrate lyase family protein [Dehalococcoidia bacterium]
MRPNRLRQIWAEGGVAYGCWLSIPSSFSAEVLAHQGFDWICVDTQHGVIDYQTSVTMLQAVSATETVPLVRVPWNEPGIIMKSLDAGAYGVIVPMVSSRAEAEAAAAACRYPPRGIRSFGPTRAAYYAGRDYARHADDEVLCIVMIETAEALANLDEILSVPGVDAAYIGPSDLSLALGLPPRPDHDDERFVEAKRRIVEACRRHGVVPGIHANAALAAKHAADGFRFILISSDVAALAAGAAGDLAAAAPGRRDPGAQPAYR